jgi:hypothetical protein
MARHRHQGASDEENGEKLHGIHPFCMIEKIFLEEIPDFTASFDR